MTQYNKVKVKLSISQFNKLKCAIKNENVVVIRLSLTMIDDSNDKGNFPHELLLANSSVIKNDTVMRIFRLITWYFVKNRITFDEKCNYPIS